MKQANRKEVHLRDIEFSVMSTIKTHSNNIASSTYNHFELFDDSVGNKMIRKFKLRVLISESSTRVILGLSAMYE
jgi:hypothetical protein